MRIARPLVEIRAYSSTPSLAYMATNYVALASKQPERLSRTEIANAVAEAHNLSKSESSRIVDTVIGKLKEVCL